MVKNAGGNKSKKVGRKFSAPQADKNIRLSESEEEIYGSVTKLLGNGMFHATDTNNKERLCIMRQKFKGRGKRDNTVSVGSWVLIGIRIWEGGSCSKPKCDLLEVYNDIEKAKLRKSGDPIFSKLRNDTDNIIGSTTIHDGGFDFHDDEEFATEEYKNIIKGIMHKKKTSSDHDDNTTNTTLGTSPSLEKMSAEENGEDNIEITTKKKNNKSILVPVQNTDTIGKEDKNSSHHNVDIDDI